MTPPALFAVELEQTIDAPPERVFRAWTDPQWFSRWFDTRRLIMDPKADGLFFFEVSWQDRLWAHYGRYLRVEAPRRLELTWMSEATQGLESIVKVELTPVDGGRTALRLRHGGLPDSEAGRGHEEGWKTAVAEIYRAMEAQP